MQSAIRMSRWVFLVWCYAASLVAAPLTIEITQGIESAVPIGIVPFEGVGVPQDIASIVSADLQRSGRFIPLPSSRMPQRPSDSAKVDYRAWQGMGIDYVAVGKVRAVGNDKYQVHFELLDIIKGVSAAKTNPFLVGQQITAESGRLRQVAHHISDIIFEKLTGIRGAFSTRIAYVSVEGMRPAKRFSLQVSDADGYNQRTLLTSNQPLLSPSWSPDGAQLAYVSFENRHSEVYVQRLSTGARNKIASFSGINSAPAWSPDSQKLALVLSKDGNPEIYILDILTRQLRRVTNSPAIETEPQWSADGQSIIFTSDRGGRPQIYRMSLAGGQMERLTHQGDYNAKGVLTPDGKKLVMVHRASGKFHVGVQDFSTGGFQVLTETPLDESPSVSPNGIMVIYATQFRGRGVLAAVSIDGKVRLLLPAVSGEVREPAWSPFL